MSAQSTRADQEYVIGRTEDFPEGTHRVVTVGRRQIGVFNIRGTLYGLPNLCPHQTGPLCEARRVTGTTEATRETNWKIQWVHEGEVVACPWHGIEYHIPTGQCLAFPEIKLRQYDIIQRGGEVVLRI